MRLAITTGEPTGRTDTVTNTNKNNFKGVGQECPTHTGGCPICQVERDYGWVTIETELTLHLGQISIFAVIALGRAFDEFEEMT